MLKTIFKNPMTIWFKRLLKNFYFELANQNLKIGYMSNVSNARFGCNNTLAQNVTLGNTTLGDYSYVSSNTVITNAIVGKFSSIGPNVMIGLGAHPSHTFVSTHPSFYISFNRDKVSFSNTNIFNEFKEISIGNDVWIGAGAIVLDGVNIGDGAIVGAGAVVTKDVNSFEVVGGVPAKHLRFRFADDEIVFLKNYKWWDKDSDWLKINSKFFVNVKQFVSNV